MGLAVRRSARGASLGARWMSQRIQQDDINEVKQLLEEKLKQLKQQEEQERLERLVSVRRVPREPQLVRSVLTRV